MGAARVGALKRITIGELKGTTVGQLGGQQPKQGTSGHRPSDQLAAPWLPYGAIRVAEARIDAIERELELDSGKLSVACRYPNSGKGGRGLPHELLGEHHARVVLEAVADFLDDARRHRERPGPEPRAEA
jgi:hypothetical protein